MTNILDLVIKIYHLLLHLYPSPFREEFEEQMLLDFSDMAADSRRKGTGNFPTLMNLQTRYHDTDIISLLS